MASVHILGSDHDISEPKRRIYVVEVGAELGSRHFRAFAAALGLGCRGLWATRPEPKYDGRAAQYGEDVFEVLATAGATSDEIITAGIRVWQAWHGLLPSAEAVKEARDFTPADAAPSIASVGASNGSSA